MTNLNASNEEDGQNSLNESYTRVRGDAPLAVGVDGCDGVVSPAVHGVMPGTGQLCVDCRHGNIFRLEDNK